MKKYPIFLIAVICLIIVISLLGGGLLTYHSVSAKLQNNSRTYFLREDAPALPDVRAKSYLVADISTGEILLESNLDEIYPIASLSKLSTAMAAIKLGLPDRNMLYPLLLESDNYMAEFIAGLFGRDNFLLEMNSQVMALGMKSTHYADPSGLSPSNTSTSRDLLVLMRYLYDTHPDLINITRLAWKTVGDTTWNSNNLFVQEGITNYLGGKSGNTLLAGGTLISIFALPLADNELRPVVVILLGTASEKNVKYEVTESIIDYVEKYVYYK
ncbi:MAG TPA: hypothetical protein VJJ22_00880 [Candidatus Paceibacterota bacterium]